MKTLKGVACIIGDENNKHINDCLGDKIDIIDDVDDLGNKDNQSC